MLSDIAHAVDVNSMVSSETELPFEYYSLPFCLPPEGVRSSVGSINPGTILMGARIQNSPYNFTVKVSSLTALRPTHACEKFVYSQSCADPEANLVRAHHNLRRFHCQCCFLECACMRLQLRRSKLH